jgi:hypothetical protein
MGKEEIEAALLVTNRARVSPPLDDREVSDIARKIARYAPAVTGNNGVSNVSDIRRKQPKTPPDRLEPEALEGLPGAVVAAISPHTESHPAAILATFLIGAGLLMGRTAYIYRDGHAHYPNEFALLLGKTSKGRKGTASRRTDEVFSYIIDDESTEWTPCDMRESLYDRLKVSGLGSGEALIETLADEAEDRRRLVFEEEFSRPLKVMRRDGSILSETLRAAWDGGTLSNRVKGRRLVAKGAHVAVLGHITVEELLLELGQVNVFNGFGNRFLWFHTSRANRLPFGGGRIDCSGLGRSLAQTLAWCRTIGEVEFDADAQRLWDEGGIYDRLIDRPPGLLGAVTTRADSHVSRLALLYALLASEAVIRVPHLMGALAVWDYSERTCTYLFGESTGNEVADSVKELLEEAHPGGVTRTEMRNHFKRNLKPGQLEEALAVLSGAGAADYLKEQTGERGKPAEIWFSRGADAIAQNVQNAQSPLERARYLVREWGLDRSGEAKGHAVKEGAIAGKREANARESPYRRATNELQIIQIIADAEHQTRRTGDEDRRADYEHIRAETADMGIADATLKDYLRALIRERRIFGWNRPKPGHPKRFVYGCEAKSEEEARFKV